MNLLEVRNLDIAAGDRVLCRGLSLDVAAGQAWAVIGPNGAGKSTLLHALCGLRPAPHASLRLGGAEIPRLDRLERARRVGLLLQQSEQGLPASVLETVLGGRYPYRQGWGWEDGEDLEQARAALAAVQLDGLAGRTLASLSGGELRRVEIARLLAQSPSLALLDEPLNHLDLRHRVRIVHQLRRTFTADGHAALMVLHDLDLALHACDHWLLLDGAGGWQAGPAPDMADPERLSALFGQRIQRIEAGRRTLLLADHADPGDRRGESANPLSSV